MRAFALKTAVAAFNKPDNSAEKDIAAQIKKEFDKEYTVLSFNTWKCSDLLVKMRLATNFVLICSQRGIVLLGAASAPSLTTSLTSTFTFS